MITRRKFMESTAALGAAAFLPTRPPGDKCEIPSTVECFWGCGSPEKFEIVLYADTMKDELGIRYVMKGTYEPVNKGQEARWWMSLKDACRALERPCGEAVIHISRSKETFRLRIARSLGENRIHFYVPYSQSGELYKVPEDDLERLIRAVS